MPQALPDKAVDISVIVNRQHHGGDRLMSAGDNAGAAAHHMPVGPVEHVQVFQERCKVLLLPWLGGKQPLSHMPFLLIAGCQAGAI